MKNKALFGVIGLVVVACGALLAFAAWKILKRPGAGGAVAGRISRDAAVVVVADFRPLRAWQPATHLHEMFTRPAADATQAQRDLARQYQEITQNCGFDPYQKTNAVTVGVERSVIEGRDQSAVAGFVDGTFSSAEAERCLRYLATRDHQTVATTTVGRHQVLTPLREGAQPAPRSMQLTLLPGSVLVSQQSYTQRALAVFDGDAPSLARDAPLSTMITRLGQGVFLGAAADLAELRSRQRQSIDGLIDDLVAAHPQAPDLALLKQSRTGGASLSVLNGSLTTMLRVEVPTAANAQSLAHACTSAMQQRRGDVQEMLRNARQGQQFVRLALGSAPGMAERFRKVDDAAAVIEALINQVQCRAEGSEAVVSLTTTQAQVTSIQHGVTAFSEIMAEASRMNPLGGLFGGQRGGGGPELGLPGLQAPAPQGAPPPSMLAP